MIKFFPFLFLLNFIIQCIGEAERLLKIKQQIKTLTAFAAERNIRRRHYEKFSQTKNNKSKGELWF